MTPIEKVLDLARWAPSGDNTQPWRFEIISPTEAVIHTFDTRHHCVYDLTGRPSQIAVGAFLETARIAATGQHLRAEIGRQPTATDETLEFRLKLVARSAGSPDALLPFIEKRCTQRRPFSRRPLTPAEKAALGASVAPRHEIFWFEGRQRTRMARLMFESAKIRLTIPEAFAVHRDVIEWHATVSEAKIPDRAIGLDRVGLTLMRWAMKSWTRTRILSTYFGGTLLPRVQLEFLPALGCGAHVILCAKETPTSVDDYLDAGAAVQRLWLSAERAGLRHQPEMTPLIFAGYHREGRQFSSDPKATERAGRVRARLASIAGEGIAARAVWMGRIGAGSRPAARSLRLPLADLIL